MRIIIDIEDDKPGNYEYTWPKQQIQRDNGWVNGYDPCENCPNNVKNGGSGICHCALPAMYGPWRVTC